MEHTELGTFTTNWFDKHISLWRKLLSSFINQPNLKFLEIGVYEGRSLFWILKNIATHPTARLWAIDNFANENLKARDVFYQNLKLNDSNQKISVIEDLSYIALPKFELESFDIIHVDGCHLPQVLLADSVFSFGLLKYNGILIFDDYKYIQSDRSEHFQSKVAIDAFMSVYSPFLEVLDDSYQLIVRKRKVSSIN